MANLPDIRPKSADLTLSDSQINSIVDHIAAGHGPAEIARKLAPNDERRRKVWRAKIRTLMLHDDRVAQGIAARARIHLLVGLGPATRALARRASTGRPDAIKLLFEASGFHNPRVQHEHSGEVTIKVDMPRPKFVDNQEPVTDADVVED